MPRRWLPWVLKLGLSVGLVWYLAGSVDLEGAVEQAARASPAMIAAGAAVLLLQIPIGAVRWHSVLRAMQVPLGLGKALRLYYIGVFFNQALPSSVGGDAVRIWASHRAGLKLGEAVNSVMLERIATVFALLLLVTLAEPYLLARLDHVPGAWVFPLLTAVGLAGIFALAAFDRLPERLLRRKAVRALAQLAFDCRRTLLMPGPAARVLGWALLGHANLSAGLYLLAVAMDIDVSLMDCLALFPPVVLVTTLPISVAGWGVREGAMVVAFHLVGVPDHAALALSVLFGIVVIATCLPGGLIWLASGERGADARTAVTDN